MRITVDFDGDTWTFVAVSTGDELSYNESFELTDLDDVVGAFEELVKEMAELVDPIGTLFDELDEEA